MSKRFFTPAEIQNGVPGLPDTRHLFYTVRGPAPALVLVWRHPTTGDVRLRLATMNPVSWKPYSMTVSFPLADRFVVDSLGAGAPCVMAWAGRSLVEASYLAGLDLPPNLDQLEICGLTATPSPYGLVPHIAECPMNLESRVDRFVDYHSTRTYFLVVEHGSLDEEILPLDRQEVVKHYHLWEVDRIRGLSGGEQLRFGMVGDIYQCPTFPVGPKEGWYSTFAGWMGDLRDEGYITPEEHARILGWHERWLAIFEDLRHPERESLRRRLTNSSEMIAWQEWDRLHAFLAGEPASQCC